MTEGEGEDQASGVALPETGTGERARQRALRQRQRRRQQRIVTAITVVLAMAIPILGYVGFHTVLTSTGGRRVEAQNDPAKPNFEANVIPTPVLLFEQADVEGVYSLTMLSLGQNDTGGAVLFIPVDTLAADVIPAVTTTTTSTSTSSDSGSSSSSSSSAKSKSTTTTSTTTTTTTTPPLNGAPSTTLANAYLEKGQPALAQLTANVIGTSFGDVSLLDDDQLAQFVAPTTPLTIDNPDRLVEVDAKGRTVTAFAAGEITLEAADVPHYLRLRNPGESDLSRLARQQLFWQQWLAAVKSSSDPNVIPGETSSGFGRYVRGLSRGDVRFATLPASPQESGDTEVFVPDSAGIADLMTTMVPLPTSANPGDRVRIRLLSGVGPLDAAAMLQSNLIPPDAQLTIIGNADRFDYTETQIVYYDDGFAEAAAALQRRFGLGQVTQTTTPADTEDVTVIIGQDLVAAQRLKITKETAGG
jgi:hypothetical protein